jgi:hypothetical protein
MIMMMIDVIDDVIFIRNRWKYCWIYGKITVNPYQRQLYFILQLYDMMNLMMILTYSFY